MIDKSGTLLTCKLGMIKSVKDNFFGNEFFWLYEIASCVRGGSWRPDGSNRQRISDSS
jgi:hypothetical protein